MSSTQWAYHGNLSKVAPNSRTFSDLSNADKYAQLVTMLVGQIDADFVMAAVMERIEIVCDKPEAFGIREDDVSQLEDLHDGLCELSNDWVVGEEQGA